MLIVASTPLSLKSSFVSFSFFRPADPKIFALSASL